MIKIFIFASHRADFVSLQLESFRKHLRDAYQVVFFNNARLDNTGPIHHGNIRNACAGFADVSCVDIERDGNLEARCQAIEAACTLFNNAGRYSNANVSHAYALCWAWENIISKERQPVAILDSDVFLVEPISLLNAMAPWQICRIPDGRPNPNGPTIRYSIPTFILLNMAHLPQPETLNWYCGRVDGVPVDVGGQAHHYYASHPDLRVLDVPYKHFGENPYPSCPVIPPDYDEFYLPQMVFHYRSGSNWNGRSTEYHRIKTQWLKERIG